MAKETETYSDEQEALEVLEEIKNDPEYWKNIEDTLPDRASDLAEGSARLDRMESTLNGISTVLEMILKQSEDFWEEQALLFDTVRKMVLAKYIEEIKAS